MKKRILTIGPVTKDYIITPSEEYYQTGGAVFYQNHTLHQLKEKTSSIISIGENDLKLLDDMPKNIKLQKIIYKQTTQYTNIYNEKLERKQKAILPHNPIKSNQIKLNLKDIHTAIISPLSPYDIPNATITYLKKEDIKTVLLPQGYLRQTNAQQEVISRKWIQKEKYLEDTDILCLDENEYKQTFNTTLDNANKIVEKYNLKLLIVTRAKKGSIIFTNKDKISIPSIKTNCEVDATGLGDTYISAFISKYKQTKSPKISGLYAAITAKEKLENKGPLKTDKKRIEEELEEILHKHG